MAAGPDAAALQCILGRCDSLRAEVYFRAPQPAVPTAAGDTPADVALVGTLAGPDCARAVTLPVTARLATVPGSAGTSSIVARAILTEPSYWTPDLPHLYRLDARLVADGVELAAWRRPVGLRRLGVRGRSLWLDGRRFVPRGLVRQAAAVAVDAFRAAAIAAVVADPPEGFLDRCDAEGVPVIATLADAEGRPLTPAACADRVACWAWHAAVLAAVVPAAVPSAEAEAIVAGIRSHKGTLLLGREVEGTHPPPAVSTADFLLVRLPPNGLPAAAWRTAPPPVPLLARRVDAAGASEPPSRHPCDVLQAAVAEWMAAAAAAGPPAWDWAGYLAG